MPRRASPTPLPAFSRNAATGEPLHHQLYVAVREAILAGRLAPHARLPSTRAIAADLGISRSTVVQAFDQLLAEGYVEGRAGAGTFVCRDLPEAALLSAATDRPHGGPVGGRSLSRRGHLMAESANRPAWDHDAALPPRPFRPPAPALDAFPIALWSRLAARRLRSLSSELLGAGDPAGYRPLREEIAAYLNLARDLRCDPDQVLIVAGAQQALDLAARVLLDPGDAVWMEEPGYMGATSVLRAAGARLVPVPVDGDGMDVAAGIARCPRARVAYVTPSVQFPLGVTMSLSRRLALLDWARQGDAWIIEDDYHSAYRFAGRPLAALHGLDAAGRVTYIGTFTNVLFPALRLGYIVVPPDLAAPFAAARDVAGRFAPLLEQAILADFLAEGHFIRHVRRMRARCAERQQALLAAVQRWGADLLTVRPQAAGMQVVAWLPRGVDDRAAATRLLAAGIESLPLSTCCLEASLPPGLLLGYAAFTPAAIEAGVRDLIEVVRREVIDTRR